MSCIADPQALSALDALLIALATLGASALLLVLPAAITGDWHADRCAAIARGDWQ